MDSSLSALNRKKSATSLVNENRFTNKKFGDALRNVYNPDTGSLVHKI